MHRNKAVPTPNPKPLINRFTLAVMTVMAAAFLAVFRYASDAKPKAGAILPLKRDNLTLVHVRNRLSSITAEYNLHVANANGLANLEEVHIAFIKSAKAAAQAIRLYKRSRSLLPEEQLPALDFAAAAAKASNAKNADGDVLEVMHFIRMFNQQINEGLEQQSVHSNLNMPKILLATDKSKI